MPRPRAMRRAVTGALAAALAVGGLMGTSPPAHSTGPCGYVRLQAFTTTSWSIVAYCNNPDHWRCDPGVPALGPGSFLLGDFFVCMDWPPD